MHLALTQRHRSHFLMYDYKKGTNRTTHQDKTRFVKIFLNHTKFGYITLTHRMTWHPKDPFCDIQTVLLSYVCHPTPRNCNPFSTTKRHRLNKSQKLVLHISSSSSLIEEDKSAECISALLCFLLSPST